MRGLSYIKIKKKNNNNKIFTGTEKRQSHQLQEKLHMSALAKNRPME